MATIQELFEDQREQEWRREGVPESDILFSRDCGMDARDVRTLREHSQRGFIIIVRCPKKTARPWHGLLPPKILVVKDKTGSAGVVGARNRLFVSDYDLMSIWRLGPKGWENVFISPAGGAPRGKWKPEATALVVQLNRRLVSRIQHGCQDNYESPLNPNVSMDDRFAAFRSGLLEYLPNFFACAAFYARNGIAWPYDSSGKYVGPGATGRT